MQESYSATELAHFAAIVAHSDDAIISKTLQGIVTSWNRGAERLYGYSAAEMIGTPLARLIPKGMVDEEPMILSRIQRGEILDHYETIRMHRSGEPLNVSVTISPIKDATGKIVGASKIARNITDQKKAQAALAVALEDAKTARASAEAANLAKSEFLANMSHELRTPMNAIMGAASLLDKFASLSARDKQLVQTIQTSSESLLALINDLLDISRIESRSLEMESVPFRFTDIAPQIVSLIQLKAREKGLILRVQYEGTDDRTYLGDPLRLRQVILNLCSNAVKFTETGAISIAFSATPEGQAKEMIRIAISDTGIGIAQDKQEAIFDKFVQADSSINRRYGGTGLGLTIARLLTHAMGGDLTVKSVLGTGSTFEISLSLPLTIQKMPVPHTEIPAAGAGGRILLVEDYKPSGQVASIFLEMEGYTVDLVETGTEAVERLKRGGYLTALMDVQMPGLNGYEATRMVREYEAELGRTPAHIIGMTAHAMPGDREKCLAAGMNDYVAKPFLAEDLKRKLAAIVPMPAA